MTIRKRRRLTRRYVRLHTAGVICFVGGMAIGVIACLAIASEPVTPRPFYWFGYVLAVVSVALILRGVALSILADAEPMEWIRPTESLLDYADPPGDGPTQT